MLRKRIFQIIELAEETDRSSKIFDILILSLIAANVFMVIVGTVPSVRENYSALLEGFNLFSVVIFTIEYLTRIWTCVESKKYSKPFLGRLKFMFTPMATIDLLAILPFYLSFGGLDMRVIRALRLFRIFRIAKVGRYYGSLIMLKNVFKRRKEELVLSIFVMMMLLLISSSLMYYIENSVQPEGFSSIPAAMWWAIAALTTVGYGDVYPVTNLGRILGSLIAMIGIGMFALPTGLLASGFVEEIEERRKLKEDEEKSSFICSHCGEKNSQ